MQRFRNIITLVVLISFLSTCAPTARVGVAEAEAAVYSTLINQQLAIPLSYINMEETVFIINTTYNTTCYICYENISDDNLYDAMPSLDRDTVEHFRAVNQESQILDSLLSIDKPYEYIDEPSPNDWAAIGHKQERILLITMLSKVGFNQDMDQALVYMAHRCGTECGVGVIYFLVREGDTWQVESTIDAWYS
jgi:hypothetical protein